MIKKKQIIAGCMAGVILLTTAVGVAVGGRKKTENIQDVMHTEAVRGDVRKIIQGTGTLTADKLKEVYVPAGIKIKEFKIHTGDTVKAGQVLAVVDINSVKEGILETQDVIRDLDQKLRTADKTKASYYTMLKKRENLEEKRQLLASISESGEITAKDSGIITSVANETKGKNSSEKETSSSGQNGTMLPSAGARIWPVKMQIEESEVSGAKSTIIEGTLSLHIQMPKAQEIPTETVEETDQYQGTIQWNVQGETFLPNTVYTAKVLLTAKEGYCFSSELLPEIEGAEIKEISYIEQEQKNEIKQMEFLVVFPPTESIEQEEVQSQPKEEMTQTLETEERQATPNISVADGENASMSFIPPANTTEKEVNTELTSLCTMTSGNTMAVEIQVDELDVLSVKEGQKAEISLNAAPDKKYEGSISRINRNGTSQNGNTKYSVWILLQGNEKMLFGMNVSAEILVEEKRDILNIPVEAVSEEDGKAWVYLGEDSKTGELKDKKQIQTGLSDGVNIEVIEGLTEGQNVYYNHKGSEETTDFDLYMDEEVME